MKRCDAIALAVVVFIYVAAKVVLAAEYNCGNKQFRRDRYDQFQYIAIVDNGIHGTTNNKTSLRTTAQIHLRNSKSCDFALKVSNFKVEESVGKNGIYQVLNSDDLSERLSLYALRFKMKDGVVLHINPSIKSLKSDVLNIQRGILSLLQIRQETAHQYTSTDNDVSGLCPTQYKRHTNGHGVVNDNEEHFDKIKNLNQCKFHQISHSNVDGVVYNKDEKVNSPILKSESLCTYTLNKKKKAGLKKVFCKEHFLVRAFSTEQGAGAFVSTRISLTRKSSKKLVYQKIIPYNTFYSTSINYDHDHQHENERRPSYKNKIKELTQLLAKYHFHESKSNSAELFYDLVLSFRHVSSSDINTLLSQVDLTKDSIRSFVFDALAQCGTPNCLSVLFSVLQKSKMVNEMRKTLSALAFIKEPTPEIIRTLMGFHSSLKDPSSLLVMSSLLYKLCNHRPLACSEKGTIGEVIKDVEFYLWRLLGKNCQTKDVAKQLDIFYALKAIGNIGRPVRIETLLLDCVQNGANANISVSAVQAFRRMKLSQKVIDVFNDILTNKNEELEKRIEIFLMLMKDAKEENIILARDLANDDEESLQFRSFISSYLQSASENTDVTKQSIKKKFVKVLREYPLKEFDLPASRYSKAFMKSFDLFGFAGTMEGATLFHPESFVPRTVNLNLTTHMFGFSVNAFDLNMRMEGLEMLLGKILGKSGYLSKEHLKNIFKVPQSKGYRNKRSVDTNDYDWIDEKVNMKRVTPQALTSIKIFGNEVEVLTLDDISMFNGKMDDMNVFKELYELTKGKQKTFKRNMILVEASYSVPTLLGLPLKIEVNSSAVVTLDVNGKLTTSNVLFGLKDVLMEGSMKPSVSVHASAKLSVECMEVTEIGTKFEATLHTSKLLHGKLHYREGKEMEVKVKADQQVNDIMNISYNLYHVTSTKHQLVDGVDKTTKSRICFDDIFNSSVIFGLNTCMDISFPNVYYNASVPYFPLTGSFQLGMRNYPADALLTHYLLLVERHGGTYDITVRTPGALSDRMYTMSVSLAKLGDSNILGLSFGQLKRGIVFNYNYNNHTNEIEAKLTCNVTNPPLMLHAAYFNKTDSSTLNRYVGGSIHFSFGRYYYKQTVFYKNMYQYWEFGSNLEYMPNQFAYLDIKIQYDPQRFTFNFSHPSTNTNVLVHTIPAFPLLKAELNVTHGNVLDLYTLSKLDITTYEAEANMLIRPQNQHFKTLVRWIPKEKRLYIEGDANGKPFVSDSKLSYEGERNIVRSNTSVGRHVITNEILWKRNKVAILTSIDEVKSAIYLIHELSRNDVRVGVEAIVNGRKSKIGFIGKNTSDVHTYCVRGHIEDIFPEFGYCFNVHHSTLKNGVVVTIKKPKDLFAKNGDKAELWKDVFQMLSTSKNDQVNFQTGIMNYMVIEYNQKKKYNNLLIKVLGQTLNASIAERNGANILQFDNSYITRRTGNEVFSHSIYYESPTAKDGIHHAYIKAIHRGNFVFWLDLSSHAKDGAYQVCAKLLNEKREDIYAVVIKDADVIMNKKLVSNPDLTLNYDNSKKKLTAVALHVKSANIKLQFVDTSGHGNLKYDFKGVIGDGEPKIFGDMKFRAGKIGFVLDMKSPFLVGVQNMIAGDRKHLEKLLGSMWDNMLHELFVNVLKVQDKEKKKHLILLLKAGVVEYLSTFSCNKKEIYERYVKDKLDEIFMSRLILRIINLPLSNEGTSNSSSRDLLTANFNSTMTNVFTSANLIRAMEVLFHEVLAKYDHTKKISAAISIFNSGDVKREYAQQIRKVISLLRTENTDVAEVVTPYVKDLSSTNKRLFITSLKKTKSVLKAWRYDVSMTLSANALNLMNQLKRSGLSNLFLTDYQVLIFSKLVERYQLPVSLHKVVKHFANDLHYYNFISRVTKFYLREYGVARGQQAFVRKLMASKSIEEYVLGLVTIVVRKSNISTERLKKFQQYEDSNHLEYLVDDLLEHVFKKKYKLSTASLTGIRHLLMTFNYKQRSFIQGFYSTIVSDFTPDLLNILSNQVTYGDLTKLVFNIWSLASPEQTNLTTRAKQLFSANQTVRQLLYGVYEISRRYEHILMEGKLKNYISPLQDITMAIADVLLLDDSNKMMEKAKVYSEQYFKKLSMYLTNILPTEEMIKAKNRIINSVLQSIKGLSKDDLKAGFTDTLMILFDEVSDDIVKELSHYNDRYLYKDFVTVIMTLAPKIHVGDTTLYKTYTRMTTLLNERLMFVVRLLNQLSGSERNLFVDKYVENGAIKYYKIYRSIWNGKLANQANIKQVQLLFDGLQKKALTEILKLTGNYSVVAFTTNIFNYIRSLNYTDLNSVIDSYQALDVNFENLTYDMLVEHFKRLLLDIGRIKYGYMDYSIDDIVRKYMPKLIEKNTDLIDIVNKTMAASIRVLLTAKTSVKKVFLLAKQYVEKARMDRHKVLALILDVVVPGIDGVIQRMQSTTKSTNKNNPAAVVVGNGHSGCFKYFSTWRAKNLIESNKVALYQNYLKTYENSSTCDIINFANTVKKFKKDGEFTQRLLSHVESIAVKFLNENIGYQRNGAHVVASVCSQIIHFAKINSDLTLQSLLFDMLSHVSDALDKLKLYQHIKSVIRRSVKLEMFDVQTLLRKHITSQLKIIASKISIKKINSLGRLHIVNGVSYTRRHIESVSMTILNAVDKLKTPLLKYNGLVDPISYSKKLPLMLATVVNNNKAELRSFLHKVELHIRKFQLKVKTMLNEDTGFIMNQSNLLVNQSASPLLVTLATSVDKYMRQLDKELSELNVRNTNAGDVRKILHLLTRKTKHVKQKINKIKKRFINDVFSNVTKFLKAEGLSLQKVKTAITLPIATAMNKANFTSLAHVMQKNISSFINDVLYQQVENTVLAIDLFVCNVKMNISKFYNIYNQIHAFEFKEKSVTKLLQQFKLFQASYANFIHSHMTSLMSEWGKWELSQRRVSGIVKKKLTKQYLHFIWQLQADLEKQDGNIHSVVDVFQKYASYRLDHVLQQAALEYESTIRKLAAKINEEISIVPPTGMEKPILRFLGLDYKEVESLFQPRARTAYLFEKTIVTFDGKTVYLPHDLSNNYHSCKHLLSRDFLWNNFTLLLHKEKFIVELKDGKIVIDKNNKQVHVYARNPPTFQLQLISEFPVQLMFTSITKQMDNVKIESLFGITVICSFNVFICNVTLSGYYHNKTLGLFGTNNAESSDEMRMPNGKLATNLLDFINSYELSKEYQCAIRNPEHILGGPTQETERKNNRQRCEKNFMVSNNNRNPNIVVRSSSFVAACMNERPSCELTSQYKSSQWNENDLLVSQTSSCNNCSNQTPEKLTYADHFVGRKNNAHILLLINLQSSMAKIRSKIISLVSSIDKLYGSKFDFQFLLVAFAGRRVRKQPHFQSGNKKIVMNAFEMIMAIKALTFDGTPSDERLGLTALKFAAETKFTVGSKIFLLFDNDASYTNSLQAMMNVFNLLNQQSIVLNVANKYRMRRNIIGKDSFGYRYHVRLPLGEKIGNVRFPPPDDYMPLVKASGGGVFTLKAFLSSHQKWVKSGPLALGKAVSLQLGRDQKLCKSCICRVCQNNLTPDACAIGY